jgi:hypothetical protein
LVQMDAGLSGILGSINTSLLTMFNGTLRLAHIRRSHTRITLLNMILIPLNTANDTANDSRDQPPTSSITTSCISISITLVGRTTGPISRPILSPKTRLEPLFRTCNHIIEFPRPIGFMWLWRLSMHFAKRNITIIQRFIKSVGSMVAGVVQFRRYFSRVRWRRWRGPLCSARRQVDVKHRDHRR